MAFSIVGNPLNLQTAIGNTVVTVDPQGLSANLVNTDCLSAPTGVLQLQSAGNLTTIVNEQGLRSLSLVAIGSIQGDQVNARNVSVLDTIATRQGVTANNISTQELTANNVNTAYVSTQELTANNVNTAYVTATGGGTTPSAGILNLVTGGDQTQAWFRVSANAAFVGGIEIGYDGSVDNYISGMSLTTSNAQGRVMSSLAWSDTLTAMTVIPAGAAPNTVHSVAVRTLHSNVFYVTSFGSMGNGTTYNVNGTLTYIGTNNTESNIVSLLCSPRVSAKYGMQQLDYA